MNYMVDLHGVVDKHSMILLNFCKDLIKSNNCVFICTGSKKNEAIETLKRLNFYPNDSYTDIISLSDIILERCPPSEIEYDMNGNIWVDDMIWWPLKSEMCKKYKIDVFVDDSEEYFVHIQNKRILKLLVK